MNQKTLVLLKPDAVKRGLEKEIVARLTAELGLVAQKRLVMDRCLAEEHYAHLRHLDNFSIIINFMISGEIVAMIFEGTDAISKTREMMGTTFNAKPGTIRGDYGANKHENLMHASDSPESANAEIERFFGK